MKPLVAVEAAKVLGMLSPDPNSSGDGGEQHRGKTVWDCPVCHPILVLRNGGKRAAGAGDGHGGISQDVRQDDAERDSECVDSFVQLFMQLLARKRPAVLSHDGDSLSLKASIVGEGEP